MATFYYWQSSNFPFMITWWKSYIKFFFLPKSFLSKSVKINWSNLASSCINIFEMCSGYYVLSCSQKSYVSKVTIRILYWFWSCSRPTTWVLHKTLPSLKLCLMNLPWVCTSWYLATFGGDLHIRNMEDFLLRVALGLQWQQHWKRRLYQSYLNALRVRMITKDASRYFKGEKRLKM